MVLRRLRGIFGREAGPSGEPSPLFGLDDAERTRIGTEDDPLRGFEAAMERHEEAERALQGGDPEKAIRLYETSVAEGFVGSQPYERLASLHESRHDHEEAPAPAKPSSGSQPAARCPPERNAPPTASALHSRPESSATGDPWKPASYKPTPARVSASEKPQNRRKPLFSATFNGPRHPM